MKLKFLEPGNVKLAQRSEEVIFPLSRQEKTFIEEFKKLILPENLLKIHAHHKYCVGMAAPQVGYMKRIILICPEGEAGGAIVMINPIIHLPAIVSQDTMLEETVVEGCFSTPGWYRVPRFTEGFVVSYHNPNGYQQFEHLNGWALRVVMHEVDHLNGVLIHDRGIPI